MGIGLPELLILAVAVGATVGVGVSIWAIADAAGRPEAAFDAAGSNRTLWIVSPLLLLPFAGLGAVPGAVYLLAVRPRIVEAQRRASGAPPS